MKWLLRHSIYITLNILYIYFHYDAYKYTSCNAHENVADLIYVAKLPTHATYAHSHTHTDTHTHTHTITSNIYVLHVCVYILCNLHNDNVYAVVYIYAVMCASHDIYMYYKFEVSTRDCKMCVHVLCIPLLELRINFYKLEYLNVLKRWNVKLSTYTRILFKWN